MNSVPVEAAPNRKTKVLADAYAQAREFVKAHLPQIYLAGAILLFFFIYFAPHMLVTIQSGEVGVRYLRFFGGTQTDRVLPEGLKFVFPWDKLFVYDLRIQEARHDVTVLTEEGMHVTMHLSIRFHPEADLVGLLHQRIGPDYKNRVVIPEVESELRAEIGKVKLQSLFDLQPAGVSEKIRNNTADRLATRFIELDGVILRGIDLPAKLKNAIEEKMVQSELSASYQYRIDRENKESERKLIEAAGIAAFNSTVEKSITPGVLRWRSIDAAKELALSPNAKTIVLGQGGSLPFLLGGEK